MARTGRPRIHQDVRKYRREWNQDATADRLAEGKCTRCGKRKAAVIGGKIRPVRPGSLCERCRRYFAKYGRLRRKAKKRKTQ